MRKLLLFFPATTLLVCALVTMALGDSASPPKAPMTGEQIKWWVIANGGTNGTSANFALKGTIGETAIGPGSSTNFKLIAGFWQDFGGAAPCLCKPGDADNNGVFNLKDITYLIKYLYQSGPPPAPYVLCSGDPNCDCLTNIKDITYLINFLYRSGLTPCSCTTWVGNCGSPPHK